MVALLTKHSTFDHNIEVSCTNEATLKNDNLGTPAVPEGLDRENNSEFSLQR